MADPQRTGVCGRDIEQAITYLKKGAYLLKYGRRGKPKFCPFRLSNDESLLIWYSGKDEKQIKLSTVSKIIPGQRTSTFQRYPRPEKEYQSFSLIYNDRSLDLDPGDTEVVSFYSYSQNRSGRAFSEIFSFTAIGKASSQTESTANSSLPCGSVESSNNQNSASEAFRVSLSSAVSSSSQGSYREDCDGLGDTFIWGEGVGDGMLGGGVHRVGTLSSSVMDAFLPKALESKIVLDVHSIACGSKHAVLVTKQGEIFSWGEESGGRLGHGIETDVSHPKLIDTLSGMNIELVACGEYHTCAVTFSGDLYTWGDGTHNCGLLGHGTEATHWIPKKVNGNIEEIHVSCISCGPWHTAIVSSAGQLFTFGDGSFGALGHGDYSSTNIPREVETLRELKITKVSCGVWHTAAVVEVINESLESSGGSPTGRLFTWGDGDKGQLGHGDKEPRLIPKCITGLDNERICQVSCGHNLTIALTTSGHVFTMGSTAYAQLGNPAADGNVPKRVQGKITNSFVEDISCGSYHVAVLTSKTEVYTWGKGSNGQLGHGDIDHRNTPTLVKNLKDKRVKSVTCGSNFTAVVCLHKSVSGADQSLCSGCHNPFGFRRKRHNCYNCGLVFCKACSSRKSTKASLAPNTNKPYCVCDDCYSRLNKAAESISLGQTHSSKSGSISDLKATKLHGTLSRLSSFGSIFQAEIRRAKSSESNDSHIFPALNGKLQLGSFIPSKASNSLAGSSSRKPLSSSVPSTRLAAQATSPVLTKSSPWSYEDMLDESKRRNEILNREVTSLRAQVKDLTRKSKILEAELERTTKQLKEVTAVAADEAEKCKSAKEVIKSLTTQWKEIVQKLPEGNIAISSPDFHTGTRMQSHSVDENHITNIVTPEAGSDGNAANRLLPNSAKTLSGKSEWVVQDEAGVYISLITLPGSVNEPKRVRFSRRHFTEEQAERWWAENGTKVLERYNIVHS